MEDYIAFGRNQHHTGESSGRELRINPSTYAPLLSGLFVTIPSHLAKRLAGISDKGLAASRQNLVSAYAQHEWEEVRDYALAVYRLKIQRGGIYAQFSESQYLAEVDKCHPYHFAAQMELKNKQLT